MLTSTVAAEIKPIEQPKLPDVKRKTPDVKKINGREIIWEPQAGKQMEFTARCEDVVLYGGAKGGGKSDALLGEALRQVDKPNYHGLLIRRTFPQLQDLIDRAHKLYPRLGGKWLGDLHRYTFKSGAFIAFGHCNSEVDKERYQGSEYGFIGFDQLEQFTEGQFNFITAQNRSSDPSIKCYVRATANPGSVGHWWIKRRFIDGKTPGVTYKEKFEFVGGRKITRTYCYLPATIYDNPILLNAQPTYLANLMSLPDVEKRAYLDGDWNSFASQCVFDAHGLSLQEQKIEPPTWTGFLRETQESFQIVSDTNGNLKIWQEPRDGEKYMIGVDVAEGDVEGDFCSAHVVLKINWSVVAHWHGRRNPLELAVGMDSLGRYYDGAEMAVELNGPGVATVERLRELGYPALYNHQPGKPGWRTDMASRSNMLATFMDAVRGGDCKIRDRDTLDELYNFIRNEKTQKIEARNGTHDDRVMSLGIALQCIRINPYVELRPRDRARMKTTTSMINDRPLGFRRKATGY